MADDLTADRQPQILTVRSSAGSGKTYRLAEHYLKVLLTSALYDSTLPTRMANIVAITFTNKAAQEMRSRIIDWMKRIILDIPFDNSPIKPLDAIMQGITKIPVELEDIDTSGPAAQRKQKVRNYLIQTMDRRFSELLSEFGHFNVGTIDSFVNLTLKASAMQLDLPPDFDVTTETRELIDCALQECLQKTGEDARVRAIFDKFIKSYIDLEGDQTDWVPKTVLASTITTLWNEETRENEEFFVPPDTAYGAHRSARAEIADTARCLLDSFSVKAALRPLANVVKAIEKCTMEPLASSAYFNRDLEGCVTKGSSPPDDRDKLLWNSLITLRRSYAEILALSKCLPYLEVFGLFKHIFTTEIIPRRRVVPIEELNRLLQNIMERKDFIPEVYYTLSEQYLHFLIDEFQDTSLLQWKNIEVLADEALSRGGSLFLVGDKKQAIYRWRGGRSELIDEVTARYEHIYGADKLNLDTNYRSAEHIVAFNNIIFDENNLAGLAKAHLQGHTEEEIKKITGPFRDSAQKFLDSKRNTGYASVEYLTGEGDDEDTAGPLTKEEAGIIIEEKVRAIVKDLLGRGTFAERDIAFLVRTREEARTIVGILLSLDLNVESEYTVSIKNNPLIREIFSFLRFVDKPDDDLSFASFITGKIFRGKTGIEAPEITNWLAGKSLSASPYSLWQEFRHDYTELYDGDLSRFIERSGYLPLYDLTIGILKHWEIMTRFPDDIPYILHLLEVIKDLEGDGVNTIEGLTDRVAGSVQRLPGAGKEDDRAWLLSAPESLNAIKVLTIHKAKGLQFPVVILPFISLTSFRSVSGVDRQRFFEAGDNGLTMLYLKKEYIEASPELDELYRSKEREYLADELNNLYVAMTRPQEELYILLTERKMKKNYLKDYLFHIPEFQPCISGDRIVLGNKRSAGLGISACGPSGAPSAFGDFTGQSKWAIRVKAASPGSAGYGPHTIMSQKKGDAIHRALSLIDILPVDNDRIASIARIAASLEHIPEMADDITASVRAFFYNPLFSRFFEPEPGIRIYNEKEIVDGTGNTFKVDRIIVRPDRVEIIDYKTGDAHRAAHADQISLYGRLISDIYPGRELRKYILYIESGEVVEI